MIPKGRTLPAGEARFKEQSSLDMEEELDKQFPKGDKARGRALVLFALHKLTLANQKQKYEERINRILEQVIKYLESLERI